ncbi:MAG: hypothetical protein CBD16_01865 [Betaproteobacteria bacterium TMED156]|nr:MAG: hypothetical protein CBD16_01865 [Betaproteobacteria bacterium TMED156]
MIKNKLINKWYFKFTLILLFFGLLPFCFSNANATYEIYGSENDIEFLYIPETFTWRQHPRVWTIIKFNDYSSKFTLIYSLEEADCSNTLLRNISQTWIKRDESMDNRINQNRSVKMWRDLNADKFEDILHNFLCTYVPPKSENN